MYLYLYSITFSPQKSCSLWHNVEEYGRLWQANGDSIIRRVRFAYWINKLQTDRHSEYVIIITCPRLSESVSILHIRMYIACLAAFPIWRATNKHKQTNRQTVCSVRTGKATTVCVQHISQSVIIQQLDAYELPFGFFYTKAGHTLIRKQCASGQLHQLWFS